MALIGFGEIDDMFRRMDHMMNSMMRGMMGGMMDPFDMMGSTMNALAHPGFNQSMSLHTSAPFGGFSSYSSSVVTMSSDGRGRPMVYEETASSTLGPGGVRETRRTVRDSWSGRQEMAVGHHLEEKAHLVKKSRNTRTGQIEEEEDFVNLEEEQKDNFEREWHQRARGGRSGGYMAIQGGSRHARSEPEGVTIEEINDEEDPIPQRLALPAPPQPLNEPSTSLGHHTRDSHSQSRRSTSRERKSYKRDKKPYSRKGNYYK